MDPLVARLSGKGSTGFLAHKGNRSLLRSYRPIPRLTPSCAWPWDLGYVFAPPFPPLAPGDRSEDVWLLRLFCWMSGLRGKALSRLPP